MARIAGDLANQSGQRLAHDVDAAGLVVIDALEAIKRLGGIEQSRAAARDDAFFDSRAGCVESVIDAILALLDFNFRRAADLDDGNAASQLRQAFLQLFLVIVRGGVLDLLTDLLGAALDRVMVASAIDDDGVVLVDGDALGGAQHGERDAFQLDAQIFRDHFALGQDGDVFQHRLATIAKARRLDRSNLQAAAQLVDDQGRQRFAFNVFRDDQERPARLNDGFQDRKDRLQVRQLLFVDQDVRIGQFDRHLFRVGDEVGRQVAAVELHTFHDVQFEVETLGLFHGDDAFLADLFHGFGDLLADFNVAIGGDDADLSDFGRTRNRLRTRLDVLDNLDDGQIDAALQVHRVHAGRNRLHAFAHDGLGQHGRGGGAVTGDVVGLRSHFADHLRAHILELVLQFDFLGDADAVLGDAGSAEALVDDDVAALRPQGHLDRIGQNVDAAQNALTSVTRKLYVLRCHDLLPSFENCKICEVHTVIRHEISPKKGTPIRFAALRSDARRAGYQPTTPRISDSFMISRSSPSTLTSVPDHLPNRTRSPA